MAGPAVVACVGVQWGGGVNYCEHHLADYALRSRCFGLLEHGAYSMLRDRYFDTEAPIPAAEVYRQALARSTAERGAVDAVLAEFFKLDGEAWRCAEFDAQIKQARVRIEKAQQNGKKGGRPPRRLPDGTKQKPNGLQDGSDPLTGFKALQTPDTRHQTPSMERGADSTTVGADQTPPPLTPSGPMAEDPLSAQPVDDPGPTLAGRACLAMRGAGVTGVNPSHPTLLRLLADGVTPADLGATAAECVERGKPGMAYVLQVVAGRMADAAAVPQAVVPIRGRADPGVTVDAAESADAYVARMRREAEQRAAEDAQRNTPEAAAARRAAAEKLRGLAASLTRGAA